MGLYDVEGMVQPNYMDKVRFKMWMIYGSVTHNVETKINTEYRIRNIKHFSYSWIDLAILFYPEILVW